MSCAGKSPVMAIKVLKLKKYKLVTNGAVDGVRRMVVKVKKQTSF